MRFSSITLVLLYVTVAAVAADHPPVRSDRVNCFSCHSNKATGKSVHSAMLVPCTTCHLVETQDSKTVFLLAMPNDQICFACHEKSTTLKEHTPAFTGTCVDCHDSHSSEYPMLLTARANADYRKVATKAYSKNAKAGSTAACGRCGKGRRNSLTILIYAYGVSAARRWDGGVPIILRCVSSATSVFWKISSGVPLATTDVSTPRCR